MGIRLRSAFLRFRSKIVRCIYHFTAALIQLFPRISLDIVIVSFCIARFAEFRRASNFILRHFDEYHLDFSRDFIDPSVQY